MKQLKVVTLIILMALVLGGCSKQETVEEAMETYAYIEDKQEYMLENENLKMELDPKTTYFKVTNKEDGSIWYSNPEDADLDSLADGESKNQLKSTLVVEYSNTLGINATYNNYNYSIEKSIYEIEQGKDYIKVDYTIGNTEQVFMIPQAIGETRLKTFTDNMEKSDVKKINDYYRKYDINNLRASDNKQELLKQYPNLEKECVYVLREGLQKHIKSKLEASFEKVGYTSEDFAMDSQLGETAGKATPIFNVSVIYKLEKNDLVVELPMEEMTWNASYPLTKIKVLPFLGAGGTKDEGFLLVPEGTGGIIEFNNGKNTQSAYYTDVYGWDYAKKRSALVDEQRAMYPVFGIANKETSVLCIIEESGAAASIQADVSGRNHSYNYVNATYEILHSEGLDVSAKTDKSVIVFENEKPSGSLKQRYKFLKSNDYSKMAEGYRDYLLNKNPQLVKKDTGSVPVNVELIGAIDRVQQRFGVPVSVAEPLTTYQEATNIIKELKGIGYQDLHVKYTGWMNEGVTHSVPSSIKTISKLGSKKELEGLLKTGKELGVDVYLNATVQKAYNNKLFDHFIINRDVAKYVTREQVKLYDFSTVWYGEKDWMDAYYLVKPQVILEYMNSISETAKKYGASGIAFSDVGYILSADYNPKNPIPRKEAMKMQQQQLQDIANTGTKVMVNGGNDYVIGYVDFISDMDLEGNKCTIIDYAVPFYTMALHGLLDYTGKSVNLAADSQEMLLKSIETGAGLSFTFISQPTSMLQDTNYTRYFGADYKEWKELAYKMYKRYEEELGHCFNQYIVKHEKLDNGVFATTYEDGTKVYVNYNKEDYVNKDLKVAARDYKVERR